MHSSSAAVVQRARGVAGWRRYHLPAARGLRQRRQTAEVESESDIELPVGTAEE
jgi:hypothetical protein